VRTSETDYFVTGRLGKAALGERTIEAMAKVPRHAFVCLELQPFSNANTPLASLRQLGHTADTVTHGASVALHIGRRAAPPF
jgi:protein-L-isoaspartate O-methyltransferase